MLGVAQTALHTGQAIGKRTESGRGMRPTQLQFTSRAVVVEALAEVLSGADAARSSSPLFDCPTVLAGAALHANKERGTRSSGGTYPIRSDTRFGPDSVGTGQDTCRRR